MRPGSRRRTSSRSRCGASRSTARSTRPRSTSAGASSSRRRTGRREAIDASSGAVKWRFTPPGYSSWAGTAQITTATPVADPSLRWIYAASPDGRIYKLSVANGHAAWSVSITKPALAREDRVGAQLRARPRDRDDRRLHRRHAAVPGPRRDHRRRERAAAARLELALLEPARAHRPRRAVPPATRRSGAARAPSSTRRPATSSSPPATRRGTGRPTGATRRCASTRTRRSSSATTRRRTPTSSTRRTRISARRRPSSSTPATSRRAARTGRSALLSVARMRGTSPHQGGELQVVSTPSGTDLFTAPAVWRTTARRPGCSPPTTAARPRGATAAAAPRRPGSNAHRRHEPGRRRRPPLGLRARAAA